jgi:hypothetical protein
MLPTIIRPPKTAADIAQGARLARMQGREIGPGEVARTLREAKVRYILVGAHASNGYTGRPRATVDVNVVVQFPKKAAKAIAARFPYLRVQDTPVVTRFFDRDMEAIDLMKASTSKLWGRLLKDATEVVIEDEKVRVPTLEGALASKFASMTSLGRRLPDKQQDGVDFMRMVGANETINLDLLEELGELVYPGGGELIRKLVADTRAGRRLEF